MGTTYNLRSDVVWAPSSQNPSIKSIYIASRGVDNNTDRLENDGKIWEVSLGSSAGAFGKAAPADGISGQPTSPVLSWDPSPGAVGYEYCIDTTNDDACTNWVSSGGATSVMLSGLTSSRTYYWQVRAVGGGTFTYADGSPSSFWAFSTVNTLFPPWLGSTTITSDRPVVAVARPHIGAEVASYDGVTAGSLTAYAPMLFKNAWGSYNAALYVQNVDASHTASINVKFYDSAGNLSCTVPDTIAPLASQGYWVPDQACLPAGWVGGAVVTSDWPIVAVGRPHVGAEVMTYNGFSAGSLTSYLPMLFKDSFGGSYDAAFYVQNVDTSNTATISIKFYDSTGHLSCTLPDTVAPLASKGYWVPGQSCLPAGWVGGVVVTSNFPIVTIGRIHVGTQVTSYSGFAAGAASNYVPMLFKNAFGGSYDSAFYVQNVDPTNTATISIKFYDSAGNLSCTLPDTVAPLASKGWWVPAQSCLPVGWVGGAVVTSNYPIVSVGRPHVGAQVTTYAGIPTGNTSLYLPMLFKNAFGGTYNSAFYIQNTDAVNPASVTIQFFDTLGNLSCVRSDSIPARATLGYWVPDVTCDL